MRKHRTNLMKTVFTVEGPFKVPVYVGKGSRTIDEENLWQFWEKIPSLAEKRGCYAFGIRAAKGSTPGWVGKATKNFRQEVFSPHKLAKYQRFLADYRKGTPILFFLVAPLKKGAPNVSHINDLESFLIQVGMSANPDLLNVKGTKFEKWGIAGVLRGGKGKPNNAAKQFRQLMKMNLSMKSTGGSESTPDPVSEITSDTTISAPEVRQ